jgi:pimeloyl-ACP methyl ester carboxylesterase
VTIPNGTVLLAGLVYEPDEEPRRIGLVLAHGFTASKESLDLLASYLCNRGFPCLTFDFRGHKLGGSTGELHSPEDAVSDMEAALEFAMQRFSCEKYVLIGHSMGALVSVALAAKRSDVAGVAVIAVGPEPSRGFSGKLGQALLEQRNDYVAGLDTPTLLRRFDTLVHHVEELRARPLLFVAARGDVLMKPERVRSLAGRAGPGATYVEIDGTHLDAPDRARGVVANWLDHLPV